MLTAAKVRIYPTPEQAKFLERQFGCVRYVWNRALEIKEHYYRIKGINLSPFKDLKPLLALAVSRAKRSVDRLFEAYESIRDRKLSAADQGKKRAQIFKSMTKAKADLHNVLHAIYEGTFFAVAGDGRVSKQTIERILNEAQDRLNDLLQAASPVDDTLANACKEAGLLVKQAQKMAGSIQEAA